MTIKDFKPGQEVVVEEKSLNSRTAHIETVVGVGRKYVTTARADDIKQHAPGPPIFTTQYYLLDEDDTYLIENKDWGHPNVIFPSEQAYRDYYECKEIKKWISENIKEGGYTIEQLREVKRILEGNDNG